MKLSMSALSSALSSVLRHHWRGLLAILLLLAVAGALALHFWPDRKAGAPAAPAYVGAATCGGCHSRALADWQGSHHGQAMAAPTGKTVLGNFDNDMFSLHGMQTRFSRDTDRYVVTTEGPDGRPQDFAVRYTFGWYPLQQYLLELPGGRLQALDVAWDARAAAEGGQRWFHLHPEAPVPAGHALHWSGAELNWNYQCADCHSTDLQKDYDPVTRSYRTTFSEINVACEACHGPGSRHVDWARGAAGADALPHKGWGVALQPQASRRWQQSAGGTPPRRLTPAAGTAELESCAQCHSRRSRIAPRTDAVGVLLDTHLPALLEEDLYFADGQIRDEVYEYGSFLQSKMHAAGVTCSDCHQPHSLKLRAEGNALCSGCHEAARYDRPQHHHHAEGSTGARCGSCHMPERTYMGVDRRSDHSFRVPRPDLSRALGAPDACTSCHAGKPAAWAQAAVSAWFPQSRHRGPHYGEAFHAARTGAMDARARLLAVATDAAQPAIVRATALDELSRQAGTPDEALLKAALDDPAPLVRVAALRWLALAPPPRLEALGWYLLDDPVNAVRLEAARVLAPLLAVDLPPARRQQLQARLGDYERAQRVNAERPENQLNLGLVAAARGDLVAAEAAYREALALRADFTPAYVNLADLYRQAGRDPEGEAVLRQGLAVAPRAADLHHALALFQVRLRDLEAALHSIRQATALEPRNPQYLLVQALLLQETGQHAAARAGLEAVLKREPGNRDAALSLLQLQVAAGNLAAARRLLDGLRPLYPGDPELAQIDAALRAGR